MGLVDDPVLLLGPGALLHLGVQVVVPALPALLADAALEVLGDHRPALRPVLMDQVDHLGTGEEKRDYGQSGNAGQSANLATLTLLIEEENVLVL